MLTMHSIIKRDNPEVPVIIENGDTNAAYLIPGDFLIKRKEGLVNCKDLADKKMSCIIIAAHCFTGSDHTPSQYDHGKYS